jgi:hypothetical protein
MWSIVLPDPLRGIMSSISNGSGYSHQVGVEVTNEMLGNWKSQSSIYWNCQIWYRLLQMSECTCIGRIISGLPSRSLCRFI